MRSFGLWIALLATLAGALFLSFGAYRMASDAWDGVVEYASPYREAALPPANAGPAVVPRVVFVIIDGLRLDASQRMSSLESLRDYGAELTLTAPQPSLSYPNWTTILSGASQDQHGVVTNWHEGEAGVETVLDTAKAAGVPFVVVGPSDIATLYPVAAQATGSYFEEWSDEYLSGRYVDETLRLVEAHEPRLVLLHLPDVDEAGHDFGGADDRYIETVARVDADLRRLVEALQDGQTAFVVVADHGHIDTGGHGGWESEVVQVPGVVAGAGVRVLQGDARLEDVAPTVAVLAGIGSPRMATGEALAGALATPSAPAVGLADQQRRTALLAFAQVAGGDARVASGTALAARDGEEAAVVFADAREARLNADRTARRWGFGTELAIAAALTLLFIAVASWRAFVAALSGTAAYYAVYNALFFGFHRNLWSLSAFNSEDYIDAWMNTRLAEAAAAGLVAVVVAGLVYPLLRRHPKGPRRGYLSGWLALGPVTVAVTQLTLALQIAWFLWAWDLTPVWRLPDLMWGFKFDLDLVQVTALGAAAVIAPLLSYLTGRYHPKVRRQTAEEA